MYYPWRVEYNDVLSVESRITMMYYPWRVEYNDVLSVESRIQ